MVRTYALIAILVPKRYTSKMDFSLPNLLGGIIFGLWGMYLVKVAKRDAHWPSLFIGIALMIYPYFISNPYLLWGLGIGLIVLAKKL